MDDAEAALDDSISPDAAEQLIDEATRTPRLQYEDRITSLESELRTGSAAQGSTEELRTQVGEFRAELTAERDHVTQLTSDRDR